MRNVQTREGFEFWDRLCKLPRYMFLLAPSGTRVQKLEAESGNWIDVHEAQAVVDAAQDTINELRAALSAMTQDYARSLEAGHDRITFLGGDCDRVDKMLADNPRYATAVALLAKVA